MTEHLLLLEIGVIIAALAVVGTLANRLGQSVIPFYILVGILLGPNGLALLADWVPSVTETTFVKGAAELGIVMLLFFLGLKFSLDQLIESRARIAKAGTIDLAINFPLGMAIGLVFGFGLIESLLIAGIVYISSSAVITKSLIDLGWIANEESETLLGILVYEDLFIAVYLALLSAIILGEGGAASALVTLGAAVVVMGGLTLVAWRGTEPLEELVHGDSEEMVLLRALGITVLIAGTAFALDLSEAVAAFFVGMAFGSTNLADRLNSNLSPLRDLFGAVFFFWVGLITDPRSLVTGVGLLATAVVLTTASKLVSGTLGARLYGLAKTRQARVASGIVARGEFSLIIGALAAVAGLGSAIPSFAVAYVLVMSILGTVLMMNYEAVERLLPDEDELVPPHARAP